MKSLFVSKKDQLLSDMARIQKGLIDSAMERVKYADSWQAFGEALRNMIISECPTQQNNMDSFVDYFNQIRACHVRLSEAEIRNAEDFRDIEERFAVVFRINNEYSIEKRAYQATADELKKAIARATIEKSKPTYESLKENIEAGIQKHREIKKDALEKLKNKLKELIETREKYNKFKVRRLCEGWGRYGNVLKEESEKEAEILGSLIQMLETMKNFNLSSNAINNIEHAVTNQIAQAPTPQELIIINDDFHEEEVFIENE